MYNSIFGFPPSPDMSMMEIRDRLDEKMFPGKTARQRKKDLAKSTAEINKKEGDARRFQQQRQEEERFRNAPTASPFTTGRGINDDEIQRVIDVLYRFLQPALTEQQWMTFREEATMEDLRGLYQQLSSIQPPSTTTGGRVVHKMERFVQPKIAVRSNFIPMCSRKVIQKKVVYGKGITPEEALERYVGLGKYCLHMPSLHNGFLNVKHPSSAAVTAFPKQKISDGIKDFILDMLEKRQASLPLFDKLKPHEKSLVKDLCFSAGIGSVVGLGVGGGKSGDDDDVEDDEDMKRFMLLKNEIVSGQNSPQAFRELRSYVLKFLNDGRMDRKVAYSVLAELSLLI
jgi:hypothetical protein